MLLTLLDYSYRWLILSLREYVIDHLEPIVDKRQLHACTIISVARVHGIPRWIEPAVRDLRNTSLGSWMFRSDLYPWLSNEIVAAICVMRERLHARRLTLSVQGLEATHTAACRDNRSCSMAWDLIWWATVSKPLLAADDIWRPTVREIRQQAEQMRVPGMTESCFVATMEELRATSVWDFEEDDIKEATEFLMVPEAELKLWFDLSSD